MSKAKQLMELVTQDLISMLVQDRELNLEAAMKIYYNSSLCEKLYDENTGLYLEGSAYLYDLLTNELQNGKLVQMEI